MPGDIATQEIPVIMDKGELVERAAVRRFLEARGGPLRFSLGNWACSLRGYAGLDEEMRST